MPGKDAVHFHTAVCQRHRKMFVAAVVEEGVHDWNAMERIRMRVVAEAARRLTRQQMMRYIYEECIGCEREEWVLKIVRGVAREERAWVEASLNGR